MPITRSRSVVVLVAAFFLAMGCYALVAPAGVLAVFGVEVQSVDGRNEVRAVYGGFGVAVAAVLLLALRTPRLAPGIFVCLATAVAGMAFGRILSAAVDESPGFFPWFFCVVELLLAGTLLRVAAVVRT